MLPLSESKEVAEAVCIASAALSYSCSTKLRNVISIVPLSRLLDSCDSLDDKLSVFEQVQEFALADGEEKLRNAGVVNDTMSILSCDEEEDLHEVCIELVQILVGSSTEILQEYLNEGLLNVISASLAPSGSAFIAETCIDILFEVLSMSPLPRKVYVDQAISVLTDYLSSPSSMDVIDRILTVLGFIINSDATVASLIASSGIIRALISLMNSADDAVAQVSMSIVGSLYKRFPEAPVGGVHKKLDRFLCHKDSRIRLRANELLSLLICRSTINSFVVRPMAL